MPVQDARAVAEERVSFPKVDEMNEGRKGILTRTLAVMCHYCPVCMYGRAKPESVVGKILHHRLHAEHCPMWKAEKVVYRPAKE